MLHGHGVGYPGHEAFAQQPETHCEFAAQVPPLLTPQVAVPSQIMLLPLVPLWQPGVCELGTGVQDPEMHSSHCPHTRLQHTVAWQLEPKAEHSQAPLTHCEGVEQEAPLLMRHSVPVELQLMPLPQLGQLNVLPQPFDH